MSFQTENTFDPDETLKITINGEMNMGNTADIIYLDPYLAKFLDKNPFPNTERTLPIEMDYKENLNYLFSFKIPEGYEIEELPQSAAYQLGENKLIELRNMVEIDNDQNYIKIHSQFKVNTTSLPMEEYENIRNIYSKLIEEQNKKIVLKKAI